MYRLARQFLGQLKASGLTSPVLSSYLVAPAKNRPTTIPGLYERLLASAQNANMKAGVIGRSIGGVRNLGPVLKGFDPHYVLSHYQNDNSRLLRDIVRQLKPAGKIRVTPRSIWPQYCRSALSAARFITQFASAPDFYSWVDSFERDARARPALPMSSSVFSQCLR